MSLREARYVCLSELGEFVRGWENLQEVGSVQERFGESLRGWVSL